MSDVGTAPRTRVRLTRPVAFIGFMGAGKSCVAEALAERLGVALIDLDREIESVSGMSVAELFEHHGEPFFRTLESELLEDALRRAEPAIIACGGGVTLDPRNTRLLHENALVIYLRVSAEEVVRRLDMDSTRPLFMAIEDPAELALFIEQRESRYERISDIRVETDGLSVDTVVEHVINEIEEGGYGVFHP